MIEIKEISKDDHMCYWIFDPKHYHGKPSCLNLPDKMQFNSSNNYSLSANSRLLCDDYPDELHNLGIKQADRINKNNPTTTPKEKYKGFLKTAVEEIENLKAEDHCFIVKHNPVEKNSAKGIDENKFHCDIDLVYPENKPSKSRLGDLRKKIIECFGDNIEECTIEEVASNTATA